MSCHRVPLGLGRPAASGQSTILYIYATKEGFGDLQGAQSILVVVPPWWRAMASSSPLIWTITLLYGFKFGKPAVQIESLLLDLVRAR